MDDQQCHRRQATEGSATAGPDNQHGRVGRNADGEQAHTPVASGGLNTSPVGDRQPGDARKAAHHQNEARTSERRWWIKLFVQPLLMLVAGALLFAGLGVAQRFGWISAGGNNHQADTAVDGTSARYICPMMCTPPQGEPGRCPVCAMELVPAASGGEEQDHRSVQIDPAARRVANIQTVPVRSMPMTRTVRAVGELGYDEGTLKTISAYVDGRLERLSANYTGIVVNAGDRLALMYSPRLYSSQVELLSAKQAREDGRSSTLMRVIETNRDLYESTRQRLIEFGMTEQQIEELEHAGQASSRMHLCAPMSGTVIEKCAVEGDYVKEGQPIYRLADLSTVWLLVKLFPEDAATVRFGQKAEAEVQSLPGRTFMGRVAFLAPEVDPSTRTVDVRIVIPNPDGLLRVGDYAKATISVPLTSSQQDVVYDPELADKWVCLRHPHVIETIDGRCPICDGGLVPARHFGFTAEPSAQDNVLVVPRDAVLTVGSHSVLYVETEPGRFELRRVALGPSCGDQIVILRGVRGGEQVATRGNFLIDSQMQLAGNPSLIDPAKVEDSPEPGTSTEMIAALSSLSPEDRELVEKQEFCPVADYRLGSMGTPKKVDVNGTTVFICCEGCRERLLADPEKYLAKLASADAPGASNDTATQMDLPPIDVPQPVEPFSSVPPIESPQPVIEAAADKEAVR